MLSRGRSLKRRARKAFVNRIEEGVTSLEFVRLAEATPAVAMKGVFVSPLTVAISFVSTIRSGVP
jgi:hypothetical protein